jgi:hypothetical protein
MTGGAALPPPTSHPTRHPGSTVPLACACGRSLRRVAGADAAQRNRHNCHKIVSLNHAEGEVSSTAATRRTTPSQNGSEDPATKPYAASAAHEGSDGSTPGSPTTQLTRTNSTNSAAAVPMNGWTRTPRPQEPELDVPDEPAPSAYRPGSPSSRLPAALLVSGVNESGRRSSLASRRCHSAIEDDQRGSAGLGQRELAPVLI